jgi:hypothetical protein
VYDGRPFFVSGASGWMLTAERTRQLNRPFANM